MYLNWTSIFVCKCGHGKTKTILHMLKPIAYLRSFTSRFCCTVHMASITIVVYTVICRKLWLRKIPGNVTTANLAAAQKSKRKVVRLLVVIVLVFAICWFPSYINQYIWFVRPELSNSLPTEVQLCFLWLGHANSAINPCLYILLNSKFREELVTIITWCPR